MKIDNDNKVTGRILIADNEESIRFSFESILTTDGYSVDTAHDLDSAVSRIQESAYDIAIVDHLLGSENGMILVKKINETQPLCSIIIVSAFPTFSSAAQGMTYKTMAYLAKPVRKGTLRSTVNAAWQASSKKQMRREIEKQMCRDQKLMSVGIAAAGIIHDFNNLFMGISGYSDLLLNKAGQYPGYPELLRRINAISQRGMRVSTKTMAFLKDRIPETQTVDLRTTVRNAIELLEIMLPSSIRIETDFTTEDCPVHIFPVQIEQSIINIGLNAMQAIGQTAGTINIRVSQVRLSKDRRNQLGIGQPECVEIRIQDTGCGMDADTLERIFTPFFTTRSENMGTGIGLFVSQKAIQAHSGGMEIRSTPGNGSVFSIFLPIEPQFEVLPLEEPSEIENSPHCR